MTEKLVDAYHLAKVYHLPDGETVEVLRDATCSVMPGDRIAVEGPSGSGKSTLLTILGGLVSPSAGEINWPALGKRTDLQPMQIAFVFQSPSLFPPLTVLQNVSLPLLLAGRSTNATARAERLLDVLGLAGLSSKLPEELSGGQAQRVAMARALVVRPKLLIADEPTGQLDTRTAMVLLDVVLDQLAETYSALILATHDGQVSRRMRKRWSMERGRVSTAGEGGG
ncbi:ATP-binding cassette domain-containing protein [Rhizobium sp. KVB221]|uniref:ATP-binding cassette domain-containing protein n=1 Tax=Rhizobium setariae TaxID=2801340 RepID=A0A936YVD5_9HYPH|nr:ATP-binding cassette domain-containing protein [Rhizobium setariae]MBL0373977.1 ATP-binding cassette domain-containing protein [Rhizobium setariae]